MLIDIIAGARPNFMKIAPIIREINRVKTSCNINYRLIHTGQHYDKNMSDTFFAELNIPTPDVNFNAGGGTQAEQAASIMIAYEKTLVDKKSDLCLVVGDVNSTFACAITAQKMGVKVAHVEAGIRSGDWSMPEEINRLVTDSITNFYFTTTTNASENLLKSGVNSDKIFFVGNTMIDTLIYNFNSFKKPSFWDTYNLTNANYLVLTLHRPSNVDDITRLKEVLLEISNNSRSLPIIFPVHPRTLKNLEKIDFKFPNFHFVEPMSYLEFNYLVKNSKGVITDSGGITEEATVFGIPCITLRDTTERPETVTIGTNELIGTDSKLISPTLNKLFENNWKKGEIPKYWDGKTSERIVDILLKLKF